jgi:SAM-dependent methyltransferase
MISVVAPAFNEAETLPTFCSRVAAALDGEAFEIVVVNDGSTDGTDAVIARIAEDDPRVRSLFVGSEANEILDFGCGTGGLLGDLDRFGHGRAVDGEEQAVRFCEARRREGVRHVPVGEALPFPEATFDIVTALDVLEHIDNDAAALVDLRRVLRPGGLLLVTVPAFAFLWGDQDEISHHYRRYRAPDLAARLAAAGLRLEHLSYFNTLLFSPIAVVRLLRRLARRPSAEKTDFDIGSARLNSALGRAFAAEAPLVTRWRIPFGVSLLALARRPQST